MTADYPRFSGTYVRRFAFFSFKVESNAPTQNAFCVFTQPRPEPDTCTLVLTARKRSFWGADPHLVANPAEVEEHRPQARGDEHGGRLARRGTRRRREKSRPDCKRCRTPSRGHCHQSREPKPRSGRRDGGVFTP